MSDHQAALSTRLPPERPDAQCLPSLCCLGSVVPAVLPASAWAGCIWAGSCDLLCLSAGRLSLSGCAAAALFWPLAHAPLWSLSRTPAVHAQGSLQAGALSACVPGRAAALGVPIAPQGSTWHRGGAPAVRLAQVFGCCTASLVFKAQRVGRSACQALSLSLGLYQVVLRVPSASSHAGQRPFPTSWVVSAVSGLCLPYPFSEQMSVSDALACVCVSFVTWVFM